MLGKLLDGRYQVVQVLSAGGFGETFIATDTRRPGNPRCVLKHLKPASSDPNYLQVARRLFLSEAEILEKLGEHSQIPQLLAYFEEEQEFYLVQQFIDGHPLSAELQPNQNWNESQTILMLQDVLGILDFVHGYGVIHRDLKPDNLIRRNTDGRLVLIDFGAVKQMRSQLATESQIPATVAIGTPGYMPAEQGQGKPRPNSDIYALGMIAIQGLTGLYPTQLQEDPQTGEILFPSHVNVSDRLLTILGRMVAYHYRDRYQTAAEVLADLQQLLTPLAPTQPFNRTTELPSRTPTPPVAASTPPVRESPPTVSLPALNRTLSIAKVVPFVGAAGVFLFKATVWIILLGVSLAVAGVGLFLLRSTYPALGKDRDAIFAVMLCMAGGLLLFQSPYTNVEIQLGQFLLAGAAIFSAAETIRLRGRERG